MANNQIKFGIGFNVDKAVLNQLKTELQQIKALTADDLIKINNGKLVSADQELKNIQKSAAQLEGALERAFNTNLGTLNISKFNQELKNLNLNKIYSDFSKAGTAGQNAFRNVTAQVLTTNMQLKKTHSLLDSMATTMGNTIKWGVASSVMNSFSGGVRKAFSYVKELDTSLNDIRIVTEKSAEEMEKFAVKANNAAKALGQTTNAYTEASLIYYQQGLGDKEVAARTETTLKAANVTGQTGQEVSEQLTAVWNGYKVSAEETELYVDKLAAVAATTASDLEELSTGMEKVASAASSMGVDIDQLNGHLSTVISVTRQAPESVGTAFKTIYARLGDLAVDGEDEFGTKLGEVSGKLQTMGVDILDAQGQMRDMGTVMEEVAAKWDTWTDAQKQAAAVAMAGKRQYNNLIALFDNWDMYTEAVETSANAAGTLQKQQDIYMESTAAHLKELKASSEDLYDSLLDPKGINPVIDGLTLVVKFTSNFIDSIGNGGGALLALGAIGTKVFSKQIAGGIATTITNLTAARENMQKLNAQQEILSQFNNTNIDDSRTQNLIAMKQRALDLSKAMTNEEQNTANKFIEQTNELYKEQDVLEQNLNFAKELHTQLTGDQANINTEKGRGSVLTGLKNQISDIEAYKDNIKELKNIELEYIKTKGNNTDITNKYIETLNNQVLAGEDLILTNRLDKESRERLTEAIKKYNGLTANGTNVDLKNIAVKNAAKNVQEVYREVINKTDNSLRKSISTLENYNAAVENNANKVKNSKAAYESWLNAIELKAKIQQTITMVGAVGQLASAFTTIKNIGSIWSNEDLSTGEKMLQITTNLGFALPMLASSIGQINQALGIGTSVTKAYIAAQAAQKLSTTTLNTATMAGATAEQAKKLAILATMGTEKDQIYVKGVLARLEKQGHISKRTETTINKKLAASNIEVGNSAIFAGNGIKTFLANLGPIGWAFLAVGALSAIIPIFDKIHISAKEAGENLEKSSEDYKTAAENLDSLNNELETTASRIKELEEAAAKGQLSFTDKEELKNLKKQNVLLESQIKLEEAKLKIKQKQVAEDAKIAKNKGTYDTDFDNTPFKNEGSTTNLGNKVKTSFSSGGFTKEIASDIDINSIQAGKQDSLDQWITDMQTAYAEVEAEWEAATDDYTKHHLEKIMTGIETEIENTQSLWSASQTEMQSQLEEGYDAAMKALPALIATSADPENDEDIKYYQGLVKKYYKGLGMWREQIVDSFDEVVPDEDTFKDILATDDGEVTEAELKKILTDEGLDTLKLTSEALGVSIEDLVLGLKEEGIEFTDVQEKAKETAAAIESVKDSVEQLTTATENKSSLDSIFESYENGMYLDQDEVASILTENPEYIAYLTEVNGKYVLNEEAMRAWTNSVKEQDEAIKNMMGSFEYMDDDWNETLGNIMLDSSHGGDPEKNGDFNEGVGDTNLDSSKLDELLTKNQELNTSLAEGKITALEYFDSLGSAVEDSGALDALNDLQGEFDDTTDYLEETAAIIGIELADGMVQINKQFNKGEISVKDYVDTIDEGAEAQKNLLASTNGLLDEQGNLKEETEDMTDAQKEALAAIENLDNAQESLAQHKPLIDVFTEYGAFLNEYANEYDQLTSGIVNDSRWTDWVGDFGNAVAETARVNNEYCVDMASTLMNYTNLSMKEAKEVVKEGNAAIYEATGGSLAAMEAMQQTSMNSISNNITSTSQAIGAILDALGTSISEMDFTITGNLKISSFKMNWIKLFKGDQDAVDLDFAINLNGTSGSSVEGISSAISDAAEYFNQQDSPGGDYSDYAPSGTSPASTAAPERPDYGKPDDDSSGGDKEKDPEKLDKVKLEDLDLDPYRRVNSELERIANNLEKLSNEQDRLYGKDLLDNLKKQSKELKNQVYWNKQKLKIAKDEKKELKKSLGKQGINFDKHGDITNANATLKAKRKDVNKDITKYNNMTAAEQESSAGKALKQQIENKKAAIEALKENIGEYEELINSTIPEIENDIQEAAYQQIEIEIQKFKVEGQLYLDMSEALEQLKDFKQKMNEYLTYDELDIGYTEDGTDLALGGGSLLSEALISEKNVNANLDMLLGKKNKDGTRTGLGLMGTIGDGTDSPVAVLTGELNGLQSEYEKYRQDPENYRGKFAKEGEDGEWYFDEAGFREAMQETSDNLEAEIQKVEDAYKENREALLQSIDLIGESYAQQMETYDFINDRIESQIEAAKLLNGEADYAGMQGYYEQASANAQAKANTAKEEMDLAYSKMNDENLSAEEREKWKAMYEESVAEYEDASFAAIEAYKAENENFVHAQADAAFGTDAEMDLADAQWEIQTALDDKYLDSIDKAYETQKLSRKLQQDMDGASLAAQKKLAKFRDEELEKLKEKDKLTQYDVDRANKLYEIELKKIALEEAQQNKSKMRLRRDSSGNYSYQFVADEEKTAEMEQELEDAQYGLREMDLEHQRELQEEMLQMQKDYKEKWIEYNLLSEEEQKAREAEYSAYFEYYQGELTAMSAQALEAQDNLKESSFEVAKTLYSEDETNFKDLTDAQKLALQDKTKEFKDLTEEEKKAITEEGTGLKPTWNTAVTTMIDKFSEGEESFKSKVTSAQTAVDTKQSELNGKINAAATGIQEAAQAAQTEANEKWLPAQKEVNEKLKKANERLSKANKLLEKQRDWWKKIKEKASEAIAKTQTYLALTAKEEAKEVGGKGKGGGKGKNQSDDKKDNGKNNNKNNEKAKKEKIAKDAVEIIEKVHYGDIPRNSGGWAGNAKKAGYSQEAIDLALKAFNDSDPSKGFSYNYKIAKKLVGLKTGGYTGQGWSSKDKNQGKVALLHEKELILNANDTANMLEMIRLTRELFAQQNSLTKKSDDKSNLEKEIQEAREAYKKVWAEYNSASASDRDAKAQEYEGLRDQLRELTRVQEEAKAASQLEYENALAQLGEQKLNVRNSIEVAKHLQDIASKQEGRLTASDIATSFEQVLSNQNKAFSNIEDVRQNKIVDGLNMTIEKVMEAMNNNLQNRMNVTDQMMNTLKDSFTKEKEKSLDQTVYVNAEFPNASKVEDIEKALKNLVNRASQKANSTRKNR